LKESGVTPRAQTIVLIVEDEALVRYAVAQELRAAGYEVLESSTAEDAIARLAAGLRIDVVFTDIQLAGRLTGWDVAEQFRAADPDVPIIYASGNAADRSRSVSSSIFLNKPYRPDDVVEACCRLT
jgi:CheY-like chemotaxis protein